MKRPCSLALLILVLASPLADAANWPRFRGENGAGVSDQKGIPTEWSDGNYKWNIELPGVGHSAPVIWDDNLFVTSAEDRGLTRYVLCLDPASGQEKWRREIAMSASHKHNKSSWASSTPVTDGKLLYVAFADIERYLVTAYDFDGNVEWRRSVGQFESQHNLGVSLMLHGDSLIIPDDQMGPSRIFALDKHTGMTRWSTLREFRKTSYATPIVVPGPKGEQLICVSGFMGITSLNPDTGVMNWRSRGFPLRTVASPVYGEGLVIASCGQGGRYGVEQIAVSLDDGHLYEWSDEGIVACVDLKTGKDVWVKRVGSNFSGSPICIDGKLYCISEAGDVFVVAASPEYELLGTTSLGDPSHSTPAVANGRLFLRTFHRLACLEAKR
jgi:outer membrane protein assembly factor BamB